MNQLIKSAALGALLLGSVAACTNPNDPGQRAAGGALIGAGTGAAIGGIAGGGGGGSDRRSSGWRGRRARRLRNHAASASPPRLLIAGRAPPLAAFDGTGSPTRRARFLFGAIPVALNRV